MHRSELQDIEVQLFIEAMRLRHGYDFRHYALASIKRRILALLDAFRVERVVDLLPTLLDDPEFPAQAIARLSVPVSELFRDPEEFLVLRERVLPALRSWPQITIWQAGCATGEEVYSLAILLSEEGLYERCQIFATDINDTALAKAEEGVYSLAHLREGSVNYRKAGGRFEFETYYQTSYEFGIIDRSLRKNIVFAHHNLVSDGVFCEVHLILCRNVFIYFDRSLQHRVLELFAGSFARGGFLCLGTKENLFPSEIAADFQIIDPKRRIYQYQPKNLHPSPGPAPWMPDRSN
ncbi:MAG: protein-glutamate O-methyltransferase CheR [Rhodospirillaceae bacterium]